MSSSEYERVITIIGNLIGYDKLNDKIRFRVKENLINNKGIHKTNTYLLTLATNVVEAEQKANLTPNIKDILIDEIKKDSNETTQTIETRTVNNYVNIMHLLNKKNISDVLKLFNPSALYKKVYIPLDNRNAAVSNTADNTMTWYITDTQHVRTGFINIPDKLRDIVQIRLMNCFLYSTFPYMMIRFGGNQTYYDYSQQRLAICILELQSQSFTNQLGLNHHFIGTYSDIELNPIYQAGITNIYRECFYPMSFNESFNHGTYTFKKPISLFDKVSIMMHNLQYRLPLYDHTITLRCSFNGTFGFPTILSINIILTDTQYIFDQETMQGFIMNVTTPNITTTDPVADAAWIAARRASTFNLRYNVYIPINCSLATSTSFLAPIGTIIIPEIVIPVVTKFYAELEVTYLDTNI